MTIIQKTVGVVFIAICLVLQSCASAKMAQELQLGKMTFESGDYSLAFHQLLPLAAQGNPEAQYAVGYMYYFGYGTTQDEHAGIYWMEKAAQQGYSPAIVALEKIHGKRPKPKPYPVFENGVPKMSQNNTGETIVKFPKAKVLTKADLPMMKNSQLTQNVSSDNVGARLPENKCTIPGDCYGAGKILAEYLAKEFNIPNQDVEVMAKNMEPQKPVVEKPETSPQFNMALACQQAPLFNPARLNQYTQVGYVSQYTPWVRSVLV